MVGTQLAPSRVYEYGMLTVVVDGTFGPAGLLSLPVADQVTLSKMLPLTCQEPASLGVEGAQDVLGVLEVVVVHLGLARRPGS